MTDNDTRSDNYGNTEMEEFILNLPLFEGLDKHELGIVAAKMTFRVLKAGETLFNEWDRADYICFVESGSLDVLKKSGPDSYDVLSNLKRGRSIAEMSIIENFPRPYTVIAHTDVRLAIFSRESFESILVDHPPIAINLLKGLARLLSQNLKKTSSRITDYNLPMG
jgi:CRP-like cAMP-binding protein